MSDVVHPLHAKMMMALAVSGSPARPAGNIFSPLLPKRWNEKAADTKLFIDHLTAEVMQCHRSPERLAESHEYEQYKERLDLSVAFGQHLQRLPIERQKYGQFGMYGTAAGLELMTCSHLARDFLNSASGSELSGPIQGWVRMFLRAWNFFDLMIFDLSRVESSKFLGQSSTTLRTCQVLRAVAAASPFIRELSDPEKRKKAHCDERLVESLHNKLTMETAQSIAHVCYTNLVEARVRCSDFAEAFCVTPDESTENTFRFAVGADDIPETWRDWLFVWGSVIVAVLHASQAGLLSQRETLDICNFDDIKRIKNFLSKQNTTPDLRYQLFTLWALDHLTPERYGSQQYFHKGTGNIPDLLLLTDDHAYRAWLAAEVQRTCAKALRSTLTDVHSQYQVYFKDDNMKERYWYDYYVIPSLPIVIDLIARYKPRWLFKPKISQIWSKCVDIAAGRLDDNNIDVLPYQTGNYNGTVNCLYYAEAAANIHPAIATRASKAWRYVPQGYLSDYRRITIMLTVAIICAAGGFFLLLWVNPESARAAYFIGIFAEITATVSAHSFLKWMDKS